MSLRRLIGLLAACRLDGLNIFKPTVSLLVHKKLLHLPPEIPQSVLWKHNYEPYRTFPHHSSPEHERLLKEELLNFPPYRNRKIRHGFQDAIMVRDYKRRQIAAHFAPLRVRLNAIRKNIVLPKDIRDLASVNIHALPRDSCFTRIMTRCVVTSRRRGCKTRWRVSRIIFRNYADYNIMSGAIWAVWGYQTKCTRRHMRWPPPMMNTPSPVSDYVIRYYKNLSD